MKSYFIDFRFLYLLLAVIITSGCEGGGGSSGGTIPDIEGNWSGTYYIEELESGNKTHVSSLTATIQQKGTTTRITTSKSGTGHELTGNIDADGEMYLTDTYDGETWTTFYRAATRNSIQINDFLLEDEIDSGLKSMATIELSR